MMPSGYLILHVIVCHLQDRVMLLREYQHLVGKQEAYDKREAKREYDLWILLPSSEICKRGKQDLS